MLIKDTDHLMLNLFRYFGDDKLGAILVNKILVTLFETSKALKMEIFKTLNYQEVILFSLEVRRPAYSSSTELIVCSIQFGVCTVICCSSARKKKTPSSSTPRRVCATRTNSSRKKSSPRWKI